MSSDGQRFEHAVRCHQAGDLQQAEQIYRQILQIEPAHVNALHLLGLIALTAGHHDHAIDYISRALQIKPDFAEALNNLGIALQNRGRIAEAIASWRKALTVRADSPATYNLLAAAEYEQGNLPAAVALWQRAVDLKPDYAEVHNNLGVALHLRGRTAEAVESWRRALSTKPDFADAYNNLGGALIDQGKPEEALSCFRQALRLNPDMVHAHNNLGSALKSLGRIAEAANSYRLAAQLKPDFADAHRNLGSLYWEEGELQAAIACYQRALEIKPDDMATLGILVLGLQHVCHWNKLLPLAQRLIEFVDKSAALPGSAQTSPVTPGAYLCLPIATTPAQQLRCGQTWVRHQPSMPLPERGQLAGRTAAPGKPKIAIGYLSADFHTHATAYLIAEMLEKHDRSRFELFGYSYGTDDHSPLRGRLVNAFDRFVDLERATTAESVARIAADQIDVLIDLKGFTRGGRPQILAARPAPVQVNYLGYPCTMAASYIDYILVDDFVVPPDQQPFYTEKLVCLPGCYQANDSQREITSRTPSRVECGLPETGFVFCSFNNSYKITPDMFDVWMNLLKAVPGSVLWLLEGNRFVPDNLGAEAKTRGVAPQRLIFAPKVTVPDHLARHRLADLLLDCFPVNAHTTASDALWAECPVLTLAGPTFVSRVAGSLLRTIGLPELIATSLEQYQAIALRLAQEPAFLADVRRKLSANRLTCGLFDGARMARHLEMAYVTMHQIRVSGEQPRPFKVSPS